MTSEPFVTSQAAVDRAVKNLSKRCHDGRLSTHCHAPVQDLRHVLHWLRLLQEMEKNRRAPSPSVALLVEACRELTRKEADGLAEQEDWYRVNEALAAVEKEIGQ